MKHRSGFDLGTMCFTCGVLNGTCPKAHDVRVSLVFDAVALWPKPDERVRRHREFEARKLGERD